MDHALCPGERRRGAWLLQRLGIVFASTCLLVTMSEHIFWSRFDGEWGTVYQHLDPALWTAYFIATYVFLCVVHVFRVRTPSAVFLAGTQSGTGGGTARGLWPPANGVGSTSAWSWNRLPAPLCLFLGLELE